MEFKGTKGKWDSMYDFSKGWDGRKLFIVNDNFENLNFICEITTNNDDDIETGNALLISKAPEMLEMLNKVNDYLLSKGSIRDHEYIEEIEQLIKEATEL